MVLEDAGLHLTKIRGCQRKGQLALKNGGGSWAVGRYIERGSAPHPHPQESIPFMSILSVFTLRHEMQRDSVRVSSKSK